LQAVLMLEQAPKFVADAFIASRLSKHGGFALGTLTASAKAEAIISRAYTLTK